MAVDLSNIYHRINAKGLLEAVDILTGRVVAVQHDITQFRNPDDPKYTKVTDLNGNTVYIARELVAKGNTPYEASHAYSEFFADLILQKIVEGKTLTKTCEELDLPYSVVNKWKNTNVEFRKRLEDAYRDRAEKHHDEVLEIAEKSRDPKLDIEARKWSAGVHSEKFSPKTTIKGDKSAPLTFFIETGVPAVERDTRDVTPQAGAPGQLPATDETLPQTEVIDTTPEGLLK